MNRLIIIGNGFDLAHGLKTKYCDFINYYWQNLDSQFKTKTFIEFENHDKIDFSGCMTLDKMLHYLDRKYGVRNEIVSGVEYSWDRGRIKIKVKNKFFFDLCKEHADIHWVDVEMAYYKRLKDIVSTTRNETWSVGLVTELNQNIQEFTAAFKYYLMMYVQREIDHSKIFSKSIEELLKNKLFLNPDQYDLKLREFSNEYLSGLTDDEKKNEFKTGHCDFTSQTTILNFNYTNTIDFYRDGSTEIKIHGFMHDENNPMLLGFGDEKDKFYNDLEDFNQNEYLRFMKSSHYTKNANYRKLFDIIESGPYQIQIMGHSCGLSDRTLLNSIFQHHNCKSIKIYYYKYAKADSFGEVDNFSEIFRNLSRHFSDKKKMRDVVVNKTYCQELH